MPRSVVGAGSVFPDEGACVLVFESFAGGGCELERVQFGGGVLESKFGRGPGIVAAEYDCVITCAFQDETDGVAVVGVGVHPDAGEDVTEVAGRPVGDVCSRELLAYVFLLGVETPTAGTERCDAGELTEHEPDGRKPLEYAGVGHEKECHRVGEEESEAMEQECGFGQPHRFYPAGPRLSRVDRDGTP